MTVPTIDRPDTYFNKGTYNKYAFQPIMADVLQRYPSLQDGNEDGGEDRSMVIFNDDACMYWGLFCSPGMPEGVFQTVLDAGVSSLFKKERTPQEIIKRCGFIKAVLKRATERKFRPQLWYKTAQAVQKLFDEKPDLPNEYKKPLFDIAKAAYANVIKIGEEKSKEAACALAWMEHTHSADGTLISSSALLDIVLPFAEKGNPTALYIAANADLINQDSGERIYEALRKGVAKHPNLEVFEEIYTMAFVLYNGDEQQGLASQPAMAIRLFVLAAEKGHDDSLHALAELVTTDEALLERERKVALEAIKAGLKKCRMPTDGITTSLSAAGLLEAVTADRPARGAKSVKKSASAPVPQA